MRRLFIYPIKAGNTAGGELLCDGERVEHADAYHAGPELARRPRNGREGRAHGPQEGYTVRFMHSRVAHAENELERRLRTAARQSLGPDATAVQVDVVVARTQQGPRRPPVRDDTYVRRLVKEETRRLEDAQFERWKR